MKQVFLLILATLFSVDLILSQDNKPSEPMFNQYPEKAQIVTSDIALFWRAYELAQKPPHLKPKYPGLSKLKIGESFEIPKPPVIRPHTCLYGMAAKLGVRIAFKTIDGETVQIT